MRAKHCLLTIGVLLLLALSLPMLIPQPLLKGLVVDQARQANVMLALDEVSYALFPTPNWRLKGVSIFGPLQVSVSSMEGELSWASLLAGGPLVQRVQVAGVNIPILFNDGVKCRVHVDQASGDIFISQGKIMLHEWRASLYGGSLDGDGVISISSGDIQGALKVERLNLKVLSNHIAARSGLSGSLGATLEVSGNLLARQGSVRGPVHIHSGKVEGQGFGAVDFDLVRFDLQSNGMNHQLNDFDVYAPFLSASGHMNITGNNQLSGSMRATGLLQGVVRIGGSIEKPRILSVSPVVSPQQGAKQW